MEGRFAARARRRNSRERLQDTAPEKWSLDGEAFASSRETNGPFPFSRSTYGQEFGLRSDRGPWADPSRLASTVYTPAMRTTTDWRLEICHFLQLDPIVSDGEVFHKLRAASAMMEEAEKVKQQLATCQCRLRYQVIHRVFCADSDERVMYLDEPWIVNDGPNNSHLKGSGLVDNIQQYIGRNKHIVFLVCRDYTCCERKSQTWNRSRREMEILSGPTMMDVAFDGIPHPKFNIVEYDEDGNEYDDPHESSNHNDKDDQDVSYPYMWFYHRRRKISETVAILGETDREHLSVFCGYIQDRMSGEWDAVDNLISKGEIVAEYMGYIYIPGEIVVWTPEDSGTRRVQAFSVTDWLKISPSNFHRFSATIPAASWNFDGKFQRNESSLSIGDLPSLNHAFKIRHLNPYPLKFADENVGLAEILKERGNMFWRCRGRNYVCYKSFVDDGIKTATDSRFMVDIKTLQQMHPKEHRATNRDDLGPEYLSQVDPPLGDEFIMCLPPTIIGFNMQKKEWTSLDVDLLEDVTWNTDAFKYLVINERMKELVQAVVTNQIRDTESTDVIRGKGSGLTMLLHGGPGTGKTLTAESVAEVAKKPLYRVTCGDIGIKAEEVEKYLETIFVLGKTWDCVVLLDEADVFLEQRSLVNLERNALVSVFLRMLEYYDGILILTSNRVGIFDEAFKSRIQLNLRYQNLDQDQRKEIWTNFIHRLESLAKKRASIEINAKDIYKHIDDLSTPKLNGREIRNAISTARQLAKYREEALGYNHLESVINEAEKFDQYLKDLHEGFSADERQHDKGERLLG